MSKSKNETIVICEPTISYSSSYSFSIGNSLVNKNNSKINSSIFTPIWESKIGYNKMLKHSKTRSSHSMEKIPTFLIQNLKHKSNHEDKKDNNKEKENNEEKDKLAKI